MSTADALSRSESGSADAVKAVSIIRTGTVQIRPEHPYGTRKPLYWWLLTSRRWTPPRPVNAYVIEHARGLIMFDTGQDRASVTDDIYFPGGLTGVIYDRLARFDIGEQDTLAAQLGALGYAPADVGTAIVSHLHQDHIGGIAELRNADLIVSAAEWAELAKAAPEPRGFLRLGLAADPARERAAAAAGRRPHLRSRAARAPSGSGRGQPAPARRVHRQGPRAQAPAARPGHPARPRLHRRRAPARRLTPEPAMRAFENTVTIRRPAEEVFAYLAAFENIPAWNYAIDETRKISARPVGVGTRYRQTRSIPSRSVEGFEVTVFEPARRLAVRGQIGPFRATIRYELEASASGTRLVNNVQLDASRAMLKLAAPLATPRIKAAVAQNLSKLRLILEGNATA